MVDVTPGILGDKTIDDRLMYMPFDDYSFCILNYLLKSLDTNNKSKFNKSIFEKERGYKTFGTR